MTAKHRKKEVALNFSSYVISHSPSFTNTIDLHGIYLYIYIYITSYCDIILHDIMLCDIILHDIILHDIMLYDIIAASA